MASPNLDHLDHEFPVSADPKLANACELCAGHGAFDILLPEMFHGLVLEIAAQYEIENPTLNGAIACACSWWNWAEFQPSRQQYALGYLDVAAAVLGVATPQQWFNVLGNSTEKGYSEEILEKWAATLGLSMEGVL